MEEYTKFRKKGVSYGRPYMPGEDTSSVSISEGDIASGSPKPGDMIFRNPKDHNDTWLVTAQYFVDNYEPA